MYNKWKVLAAAGIVSMMVAAGGTYYVIRESDSLHSTQRREIRTIARLKLEQMVQWRNEKLGEVRVISQSPYFSEGVQQWLERRTDQALTRRLKKGISLYKEQFALQNVMIAARDGRLLLSLDSSVTVLYRETLAAVEATAKHDSATASDCYYCPTHGRIHYDFISPLRDARGRTNAVLIFRTDPRMHLFPLIEALPARKRTIETEIVQKMGDSVLFLNEQRFRDKGASILHKSLGEKENDAVKAVLGYKGTFEGIDYRGVEVIAYIAPIPDTRQILITKIDHSELYDQLAYRAEVTAIISITLILLVGAGFAFYYRSRQKNIFQSLFLKEKELREYHEEFRAILDNIENGVISTDLSCRVKKMNRAAEELTGWDQAEAEGRTIDVILKIVHESSRNAFECPASKVLNDGLSVRLRKDILLVSKNGTAVPITYTSSPIRDEQGKIEGAIVVFRDKTEEHRADRALLASEEKYRKAFMTSPDSININRMDDGMYMSINQGFTQIMGYTEEEALGKTSIELNIWDDPVARRKLVAGLAAEGSVHNLVARFRKKNGAPVYGMMSASLIELDGEKHILSITRDISELKEAEEALRASESRYRMLFERSNDAIFVVDTSTGRYLDANRAAEVLVGRSVEQIKRMRTVDLSPKGAYTRLEQTKQSSDSMQWKEVVYIRPDGTTRIAILDSIAVSDGEIFGIARDITQSRRTELALRENEEKYRGLVENSPDAIAIYVEGIITFVNNETVRLMAASSKDELIGRPVMDFVHPESRARVIERMKAMAIDGQPLPIEREKFIRLDSTVVDAEVKAMAITFEQKPAVQLIVRDITERKRLEEQLLQSQKLEGVGTLAGGIAHDFNNLLAMVLGSAELLQRQLSTEPSLKKHVDRIIEASERGSSISRQLLIFSRPDQAKLVPISLTHTIAQLQEMLRHFLPKSIQITTTTEGDRGNIMGDEGQIHQALLNLALNASDAMMQHGSLTIREFSVDFEFMQKLFPSAAPIPYRAISVTDTGAGMDAAILSKIFDPFFSTKERGKGTGLGLAMVHGIVKNHNGFIDVDSTPGEGTTFTLYFPSLIDAADVKSVTTLSPAEQHTETILLVDDEEHIREMTAEFLTEIGYRIHSASNGADALELFRKHHETVDLVITDLGMPQMGGEELYLKLKEIDADVKVMVSSGYLDGITKEHLIRMGIKDVLTKPSKLQDTQKAIRRVIEAE